MVLPLVRMSFVLSCGSEPDMRSDTGETANRIPLCRDQGIAASAKRALDIRGGEVSVSDDEYEVNQNPVIRKQAASRRISLGQG